MDSLKKCHEECVSLSHPEASKRNFSPTDKGARTPPSVLKKLTPGAVRHQGTPHAASICCWLGGLEGTLIFCVASARFVKWGQGNKSLLSLERCGVGEFQRWEGQQWASKPMPFKLCFTLESSGKLLKVLQALQSLGQDPGVSSC